MGCGISQKKEQRQTTAQSNKEEKTQQNQIPAQPLSIQSNELKKGFTSKDAFISETTGDIHDHYIFGKVLGKGTF